MEIVKKYFDCIEKKINILYIKVKFIYIYKTRQNTDDECIFVSLRSIIV